MAKYNETDPRTKLHPEEPWFFLRSQDRHAPATVLIYATLLETAGDHQGAIDCLDMAERMKKWQAENLTLVKDPD